MNNAFESIFAQLRRSHCKINYSEEELEKCDENLNHAYLENQYGQILDVLFFFHATNTCYMRRCNPHLRLVTIISITGTIRKMHI